MKTCIHFSHILTHNLIVILHISPDHEITSHSMAMKRFILILMSCIFKCLNSHLIDQKRHREKTPRNGE
ncbi:hypothetical protein LXL04_003176 [Taraxacum kok-saghyz]